MRRLLTILMLVAALMVVQAAPRWETVEKNAQWLERVDDDGLDVSVSEGMVYVTTAKPATVKVFTILGQLLSQENLPAGTHRIRLANRGIYLLKIGSATRRITI